MTHAQPNSPRPDQPDRPPRLSPAPSAVPAEPPKPARLELRYDTTHDTAPDVDGIVARWRERGWT